MILQTQKKAILVVSFGISYRDSFKKTIEQIENEIQAVYQNSVVYRAFTSQIIINKLKKKGIFVDTIKEAMDKIVKAGYHTVICQPTYIMHGMEYQKMLDMIEPYKNVIDVRCGAPLLSSVEDYDKVTEAIIAEIRWNKKDTFVLIGHGTKHFNDTSYSILNDCFLAKGYPNILVDTLENPSNTLLQKLKIIGSNIIYIMPFLIVTGKHTRYDIYGDVENTWKTKIMSQGYTVYTIEKALGEYPSIRNIFIEHIQNAIKRNPMIL